MGGLWVFCFWRGWVILKISSFFKEKIGLVGFFFFLFCFFLVFFFLSFSCWFFLFRLFLKEHKTGMRVDMEHHDAVGLVFLSQYLDGPYLTFILLC